MAVANISVFVNAAFDRRMYPQILLLAVEFLLLYQAQNAVANPLVGMNVRPARDSEFPSVVCIVTAHPDSVNNADQFEDDIICTGTLISLYHVLTAEHCSNYASTYRMQTIVGSYDVRSGRRHDFQWWVTHNQWAQRQFRRTRYTDNDVSMIKMIEAAHRIIRPTRLTTAARASLFNAHVMMAGWGLLNRGVRTLRLHTANSTVISDHDCLELYRRLTNQRVTFSMAEFCTTANPYILLESGDSGGPVFRGNTIVGINVGTYPDMDIHPDQANIHASVYYYRRFIREKLRE